MPDLDARLSTLKLVIFDVDGVLTDGSLFVGDGGEEYKSFYSRDGHGMKMLQATGVRIAVITGRESKVVSHRMTSLGIEYIYQGQIDKLPAFNELLRKLQIDAQDVAFVGDDVVDLPIMNRVGCAVAVADAHHLVAQAAHWQTKSPGGRGAAREVCERIMAVQGNLDLQLSTYHR